jgi:hypothetical protein
MIGFCGNQGQQMIGMNLSDFFFIFFVQDYKTKRKNTRHVNSPDAAFFNRMVKK